MELFFVPGPACLWGDDYLSLLYKVIFYTGKSIALGMGWEWRPAAIKGGDSDRPT